MIGYLDDAVGPLVLMFPKMCGYVKTCKNRNNKLSFHIDDDKLLKKYKIILT